MTAGRKKKLTNEQVLKALQQSHGLKTGAAELLGVAFQTIENYIQADEELKGEVIRWRHRRKDRAEYKLDEAIERGEPWSVMFTLKNAKDREYSDRVDVKVDGQVEGVIRIIVHDDNEKKDADGA